MDEPMNPAKEGVAILGELMKAAGDNPNVKAAGSNLGQAALTISKTINNALLPLAAVNFAFDKARLYFEQKFAQDMSHKAAAIPLDQIVEPKASIAGPALQGLAFTHEEPNLKEMYLSLLATAMDGRVAPDAHPAFVEILKQLTSEEAQLLKSYLPISSFSPIVEFRSSKAGRADWTLLQSHCMNLRNLKTGEPVENPRQAQIIENWLRLGLVSVSYTQEVTGADAYSWVNKRPEYLRHKALESIDGVTISIERGALHKTALGIKFGQVVGLI